MVSGRAGALVCIICIAYAMRHANHFDDDEKVKQLLHVYYGEICQLCFGHSSERKPNYFPCCLSLA